MQVVKFRPRDIVRDIPPEDLDINLYSDGANVVMDDNQVRRINGQAVVFETPITPPEWLLNTQTELTNYWLYMGNDKVGVWDGSSHTDITPAGMTPSGVGTWSGGVLNDIPVFNNEVSPPYYWPLSGLALPLPGFYADTTAKILIPYKYFLVALNITGTGTFNGEFGNLVLWSEAAPPGTVPGDWTPAPDNEAGSAELSETPGQIVAALPLRDGLMIYKSHSAHFMQYVGGNNVMNFRTVFTTTGALTKNSVVEFGGSHVILADGDVMQTDGNSVQSIIDARNRRWLFNQLDNDNVNNAFVALNRIQNEVWICFPIKGSTYANVALTWSFTDNAWGVRTLPDVAYATAGIISDPIDFPLTWDDYQTNADTWDTYSGTGETWEQAFVNRTTWADVSVQWDDINVNWNRETFPDSYWGVLMAAPVTTELYAVDAEISTLTSYVRRDSLDFGLPNEVKTVRRIYPRVQASGGTEILVRLGYQETPDQQVQWTRDVPFIVGTDTKVDLFATGRYISVQMTSNQNDTWIISGFDLEYSVRGNW